MAQPTNRKSDNIVIIAIDPFDSLDAKRLLDTVTTGFVTPCPFIPYRDTGFIRLSNMEFSRPITWYYITMLS